MTERRELYPPLSPYCTYALQRGLHVIRVEECGRADGLPVIFLHGGPGSSCKPYHRQFFDAERYRIILFDQRGAGRSTPRGETRDNTTQRLISDMEYIREHLNIDRWVLFGGSWGATLALLYAQWYPGRVLAMILRGAFLARQRDLDWFYRDGGANRIFPDAWERFVAPIPAAEHADLVGAYHGRLHDPAGRDAGPLAAIWSAWAGRIVTSSLENAADQDRPPAASETTLNEARIETHYAFHRYFLAPDQLLRDVGRLPAVPTVLIHGRRDLTCALEASWALHKALPEAQLVRLEQSGHLASEPAMIDALVRATDRTASRCDG